jgi:hypothetical protein
MGKDLKKKIEENFKQALKEKKETEVSTLKLLRAEIFNKEKEKRYKIAKEEPELTEEELEKESKLSDEEIKKVILSEIKKRKEAILEFEKGKRVDLVKKEKEELKILKKYLPDLLSQEEIEKIVKEAIEKTGAKDVKDLGKVMKEVLPKIRQRAEGSEVSKIAKKLLTVK